MTETAFREETTPKLRPWQVEKLNEEKRRLESTLNAPPHIASLIHDRGKMTRQLRSLNTQIETQMPRPYAAGEVDSAVARETELLSEITTGMPTQAEMRRNPAGARDKHRAWEKRNKVKILEWRNIRLRRRASGASDDPDDARDICNIEVHRPAGGPGELNMHNEQISGQEYYLPPAGSPPAVVMSEAESEILKALNPELHARMALLDEAQRTEVLAVLRNVPSSPPGKVDSVVPPSVTAQADDKRRAASRSSAAEAAPAKRRGRRKNPMSPEERKAWGQKMKAARAAKKAQQHEAA